MDDISKISKMIREMDEKLSKVIRISHHQVIDIVIEELIEKYKFNVERKNKEWELAFEKVLQYYLDDDEMRKLKGCK